MRLRPVQHQQIQCLSGGSRTHCRAPIPKAVAAQDKLAGTVVRLFQLPDQLPGGGMPQQAVVQLVFYKSLFRERTQGRHCIDRSLRQLREEAAAKLRGCLCDGGLRREQRRKFCDLTKKAQHFLASLLLTRPKLADVRPLNVRKCAVKARPKVQLFGVFGFSGQQHDRLSLRGSLFPQRLACPAVVKADIIGIAGGTPFQKKKLLRRESGIMVCGGLRAQTGDHSNTRRHFGAQAADDLCFLDWAVVGQIEAYRIAGFFRRNTEACVDVIVFSETDIRDHQRKNIAGALAQELCALVDSVAELGCRRFHKPYFLAADISAPVQNIGDGSLRYTGKRCNIFQCSHIVTSPQLL